MTKLKHEFPGIILFLVSLVCLFLAAGVCAVRADEVALHLQNGDRLSGNVLSEDEKQITIETSFGKVTIPINLVTRREKISSASPTPSPSPKSVAPPTPSVPPSTPDLSFQQRYLKNVHGTAQIGTDLGFGTTHRQLYTAHALVSYATNRFQDSIEYNAAYGKTDSLLSANRMDGTMRTTYDLAAAKRLYVFNNADVGYDEIRRVRLSYDEGAGLGYKVITRTNLVATIEAGGQFHDYMFTDNTSKESIAVTLGQTLSWGITKKLLFKEKSEISPDVQRPDDYRVRFEANLSYVLWKSLTLNLNVIDLYDSRPVLGVKANDLSIQSTLGIKF